tara:strand:+ start:877 stop:1248 length:372 start_codon:yes stop_codon:yes gene_type:complete
MSNTHSNNIVNVLNGTLVVAGIASLVAGTSQKLQADLLPYSGQGTLAGAAPSQGHQLVQGTLHYATIAEPNMGPLVALGMLLILLGCSIHALFVIRNQEAHLAVPKSKSLRKCVRIFRLDLRR